MARPRRDVQLPRPRVRRAVPPSVLSRGAITAGRGRQARRRSQSAAAG
eukprot:CAMPEP_0176278364 /NCGR_PEP_ID=MMETSP0121_2-20121125/48747_1 /TAXON_ID=160619 /ORGANISM="Kryptoperidinium foliaceum, Strain CCMP 1326" /LENGTH=47 /DNA_ID= /DNA_START= /DNA_END= /DNA_ORIENTATION=